MSTDLLTYLPEGILVKVNRASMAISLEKKRGHRFLTIALSNSVYSFPDSFVPEQSPVKETCLPASLQKICWRDRKAGLAFLFARWFRGPLSSLLHDALSDRILNELGIENLPQIRKVLQEHASGERGIMRRDFGLYWF